MTSVAVLGLGAMGSRLAANLADAGHRVVVWNRTSTTATRLADTRSGIHAAPTARDAVTDANVVISMVADDAASAAVWLDPATGVLPVLDSSSVAIESSTITPGAARTLGARAAEAGVGFLDAPVVGSRPQADAGALLQLVGGSPDVLDRVRPVLEVSASAIRHVGDVGDASVVKLAINGLFGIQVAAYAEIVGLLAHAGFEVGNTTELLSALPITSPGLQRILGLVAEGAFDPNFPVRLVAKDLGYLASTADDVDAEVPISRTAAEVFAAGAAGGAGELDIAGIATRYL